MEYAVNKAFKQENYFYTSLGNSFDPDIVTMEHIRVLIKKYHIGKIYFVLSNDNQIILDALEGQFFSKTRGLKHVYLEITKQRKTSAMWSQTKNPQSMILSYYLNNKIRALQTSLSDVFYRPNSVSGIIYDRDAQVFKTIYSDLICSEKFHFN
ncbi:MAG: hypothetical protein ABJN84_02620 [Flavobacteriaceae bacterium]